MTSVVPAWAEDVESKASHAFAPLRIAPLDVRDYPTRISASTADDIVVTRIASGPCLVQRTRRIIASTDPDLVKVALHVSGKAGVEQDGRQTMLRPGDIVSYLTTRPYELKFFEPYETIVLGVPRQRFGLHADSFARIAARAVSGTSGAPYVFRSVADVFCGSLQQVVDAGAQRHFADSIVSVILGGFAAALGDSRTAIDGSTDDLADRILAYCETCLGDPALSLETIAAAHHISVRYLHKLMQSRGVSLGAFIRRRRLENIRRDLSDTSLQHRTVAAVASRWGLLDATHLSRALKAEFGMTASQIRRGE